MKGLGAALITGGAGGIARAVASALGKDGYSIVLADIDESGLERACDDLRDITEDMRAIPCNILDDNQVTDAVDFASRAAPLRVLVNVAGLGTPQTDDGRMILRVNLEGTARMCRACAPALQAGDSIVSIGSVSALRASADADELLDDPLSPEWIDQWDSRADDTWEAYGYSKRGVLRLTERLAVELGPRGVRANVVSPVVVATRLGLQALEHEGERVARIVNAIPLQRLCQANDVANAVAFLASERASFITGVDLRVDGGSGAAGLHRPQTGT